MASFGPGIRATGTHLVLTSTASIKKWSNSIVVMDSRELPASAYFTPRLPHVIKSFIFGLVVISFEFQYGNYG
jgi:hypothetical protein